METLKVSSKSNPNNVAGAITNILKEKDKVEVQVIGAGALNQLVKAIIIARGFVAPLGKNIVCIPSFNDIKINDEEKTAIKMIIELR
ncbi:MAG: stage V sporulation protein S [Bacilli bacterium]|nr:stage V sporulation protein S [Bacilli bacterium]